jgi:hypothetical protein
VPALSQQVAQPQFKSSELQVTVNRAKRNAAGQLVVSLQLTNVSQENIALYGSGGSEATTETGDTVVSSETKGLPVCTVDCNLTNAIVGLYVDPVVIERGNSLAATLILPSDAQSPSCAIDLTTRIYVARLGQSSQVTSREKWRLSAVSLSNVKTC